MDIVAESLSAHTLSARNVTVRGQDILEWFQSKLSSSVSFVGVFQDLDDAPKKNGAVAIVGSKDYIYSEQAGKWQEFGDEGQIGALAQQVAAISQSLTGYVSAETDPVFRGLSGEFLTKDEFSGLSSNFLTEETEPAFAAVSSTFLTAHQSLSGYYAKSETSSANEISSALCAVLSAQDGKIFIDDRISGVSGHSDLSVVKLRAEDYVEILRTGAEISSAIYIVEDENEDVYGQRIMNVAPPVELSDAANKEYVDGAVSGIQIPSDLSAFSNSPGYLTAVPGGYKTYDGTKAQLSADGFVLAAQIPSDLSAFSNSPGYLTAHQSLSGYYAKSETSSSQELETAFSSVSVDMSGYYAKSETSSASEISSAQASKLDSFSVAPPFAADAAYLKGEYVTYGGRLYRFSADHAAGGWTGADVDEIQITAPDTTIDVGSDSRLRVVDAEANVLWSQGYRLADQASAVLECDRVNLLSCADGTTSLSLTLPSVPSGVAGDLIVDIDNSQNASAVSCEIANLTDMKISVVVTDLDDLNDMLTFEANAMCELYFTQTAFAVDGKPTWKVMKQVVVPGVL